MADVWGLDWTYVDRDGKMHQGMPDFVRDAFLEEQMKKTTKCDCGWPHCRICLQGE